MDWTKVKTALDWARRIGGAVGAWLWLLKILLPLVGLGAVFLLWSDYENVKADLARAVEARAHLSETVTAQAVSERQIAGEKDAIFAQYADLKRQHVALEAEVGKLKTVVAVRAASKKKPVTAAAREEPPAASGPNLKLEPPVLLRQGDDTHIEIGAVIERTPGDNTVLLVETQCWRDSPGKPVLLFSATPAVNITSFQTVKGVEIVPAAPQPSIGFGPRIGLATGQGLTYGAVVSPRPFDFWFLNGTLVLGASANAKGDVAGTVDLIGRLR